MDPRVEKAISLIHDVVNRQLQPQSVNLDLNLSASRLRHLFKAQTSMTPTQYLKSQRLERAHYLLEATFLSVKQIRQKVGLRDDSHFVRDFKRAYGFTPKQYRLQYLERFVTFTRPNSSHSHGG